MKRWKSVWLTAGAALAATAVAVLAAGAAQEAFSLKIDKIDVAKEEFQMMVLRHKAQVLAKYSTQEVNQADFWRSGKSTQKDSPLQQVIDLALEQLARYKAMQAMAGERKLEFPFAFSELKARWGKEMQKRKQAYEKGEVAYGPSDMDLSSYYSYQYSNLQVQLEESLKAENPMSDQELKQIYEQNQQLYTYKTGVEVLAAQMPLDTAPETIQQIRKLLQDGAHEKELQEKYPQVGFYRLAMNDLKTEEGKSGVYTERWEIARQMKPNEVCDPFEAGASVLILRCESREENGVQPFSEIKDILESQLKTAQARQEMSERAQNAKIHYQQQHLEQAALEVLEQT